MDEFEEYNDIVVKKLINYIERDVILGPCYFETRDVVDTKLSELFDGKQVIRSIRNDWGHYYILLDNNELLVISFSGYDKEKRTAFKFDLYPYGDKCYLHFVRNPEAYSNDYQVFDSNGNPIDDPAHFLDTFDFRKNVYIKDVVVPTSIEQIKERARKGRTK